MESSSLLLTHPHACPHTHAHPPHPHTTVTPTTPTQIHTHAHTCARAHTHTRAHTMHTLSGRVKCSHEGDRGIHTGQVSCYTGKVYRPCMCHVQAGVTVHAHIQEHTVHSTPTALAEFTDHPAWASRALMPTVQRYCRGSHCVLTEVGVWLQEGVVYALTWLH